MLRTNLPPTKVSKVIVCGAHHCGKTAILEQLIYGNHLIEQDTIPTIEDIYYAQIESDKGKEKMLFYDTGGMDYNSCEVSRAYLASADAFVLVYAINDLDSFNLLDHIKKDIDKHKEKKEIIVLGNKADLASKRQVDSNLAQTWCYKEKVKLFEVTVSDRKALVEPFLFLANKLNPPQSKSTFPQLVRKTKPAGISLEL